MRFAIISLFLCACSVDTSQNAGPPPKVSVVQSSPNTLDVQLEGHEHLRGLQLTLDYDAAKVQLMHIDPGPDAQWLDTVRMGGPTGHTFVLISDTRQIPLPKAGVMARVTFAGSGAITSSHVVMK